MHVTSVYKNPISVSNHSNTVNHDKIWFGGRRTADASKYPKDFLRNLRNRSLTCAICGKKMIPLDIFNSPARDALNYLQPYTSEMTDINKKLFFRLKAESAKYPDLTPRGLLLAIEPSAKRAISLKRANVIEKLSQNYYKLPLDKKKNLIAICSKLRFMNGQPYDTLDIKDFNKLFYVMINGFIDRLDDKNQKKYYEEISNEWPTHENNVNAAILEYIRRERTDSLMNLYSKPFAVLSHLIPYSKGGDIVVWTCNEDDILIKDYPLSLFTRNIPGIAKNMEAYISRLVAIYKETLGVEPPTFSEMLKNYIIDADKDMRTASENTINPDISELLK